MNYTIDQAKHDLPLPLLMRLIGVPKKSIPKADGQNVPCPWHRDRTPSFGIYMNKTRAHCFSCEFDLDGPQFISKWKNVSKKEGCRQFLEYARRHRFLVQPAPSLTQQGSEVYRTPEPHRLLMPPHWPLMESEIAGVAWKRQISVEAVRRASQLGLLYRANVCHQSTWLLTDPAWRIAEARMLSGEPFPPLGHLESRKAHTIKGSCKSWPVGVALLESYPEARAIMLVEGGPDYLAALHFSLLMGEHNVLPIAMLGRQSGQAGIDPLALYLLRGRRVRIYPHADADGGGMRSAKVWATQLRGCGCSVDFFTFNDLQSIGGSPIKDLNDLTSLHPCHYNRIQHLLP